VAVGLYPADKTKKMFYIKIRYSGLKETKQKGETVEPVFAKVGAHLCVNSSGKD
jgi:hypothetical protein